MKGQKFLLPTHLLIVLLIVPLLCGFSPNAVASKIGFLAIAVLALGVLVFVHELGHFLLAKAFNVGVLEFAIGFGRSVCSVRWGETLYSLRLVPLGGYVRMVGDDPRLLLAEGAEKPRTAPLGESSQDSARASLEPIREFSVEDEALLRDKSRWFLQKSYLPKALIVLAGPGFNLIFAVLLAILSFAVYGRGTSSELSRIGDVFPGLPAEKAGIKGGDLVLSVNGEPISLWKELAERVAKSEGKQLTFLVRRAVENQEDGPKAQQNPISEELKLNVLPELEGGELAALEGRSPEKRYKIGIVPAMDRTPVALTEAVRAGPLAVWGASVMTVRGLSGMLQGLISPKHIAGPIFIFDQAAKSAKKGLEYLFDFMIFLSVSLAILNLLPIPILDGGHLMFFTIELLKGSPVSIRVQEFAHQVGMGALLLLMVFAVGNDLLRLW